MKPTFLNISMHCVLTLVSILDVLITLTVIVRPCLLMTEPWHRADDMQTMYILTLPHRLPFLMSLFLHLFLKVFSNLAMD